MNPSLGVYGALPYEISPALFGRSLLLILFSNT